MIPGPWGPMPGPGGMMHGWGGMMPGFNGMMPGYSGKMPGAGPGMPGWGGMMPGMGGMFFPQLPALLQAMEACLAMASVILSLITQALRDEVLQNLPEMRRFTDAFGNYLQSLMVASGSIRRILGGERSSELLTVLQEQLEALPATHQPFMETWQQLSRNQTARRSPTIQALARALERAQPVHHQLMTALQPLLPMGMQHHRER